MRGRILAILGTVALALAAIVAPASAGATTTALAATSCLDRWPIRGLSANEASAGGGYYAYWRNGSLYNACVRETWAYDMLPGDRYGAVVEARWRYSSTGGWYTRLIAHASADNANYSVRDQDWTSVYQVHFRVCNMHDDRWNADGWNGYYGTCAYTD